MLIYGYVGDTNNYAFYYVFVDNEGNVGTSLNCRNQIYGYFIPDAVYCDVEMSDVRVHMDSDGDGTTDFEEDERFCINVQNEKTCIYFGFACC